MAGTRSSEVDHHVGRRLRACRSEMGMSQEKLAAALGISVQQVQKYEIGVNRVSASRLWDIAGCLDVDVEYFFKGISAGRARKLSKAKTARGKGRRTRR